MVSKLRFCTSWKELVHLLTSGDGPQVFLPSSLHDYYWWPKLHSYRAVDVFMPDGMPVVWFLKLTSDQHAVRLYGPTIFRVCLKHFITKKHVFLGSSEVLPKLINKYSFAHTIPLPFSNVPTEVLTSQTLKQVQKLNPDFIWLGVGSPKQVELAALLKQHLKRGKIMCVGAAFDFATGTKGQAPGWIQNNGLEWLFRLITEPQRLWKRYLIYSPIGLANLLRYHFSILPRQPKTPHARGNKE